MLKIYLKLYAWFYQLASLCITFSSIRQVTNSQVRVINSYIVYGIYHVTADYLIKNNKNEHFSRI